MKRVLFSAVLLCLMGGGVSHASYYNGYSKPQTSVLVSSATTVAGVATVTLSTPTAGSANSSGWYDYITHLHVEMYATGTLTGGATPVNCTITNVPTSPVLKFQTAEATGTEQVYDMDFASPIQGNQGFQIVVSCPSTASVVWNMWATYFQAP